MFHFENMTENVLIMVTIIRCTQLKGHWTSSTSSPNFCVNILSFLHHLKCYQLKWQHAKFHCQIQTLCMKKITFSFISIYRCRQQKILPSVVENWKLALSADLRQNLELFLFICNLWCKWNVLQSKFCFLLDKYHQYMLLKNSLIPKFNIQHKIVVFDFFEGIKQNFHNIW